jgi:hypothetical protein
MDRCRTDTPALQRLDVKGDERAVACWLQDGSAVPPPELAVPAPHDPPVPAPHQPPVPAPSGSPVSAPNLARSKP